MGVSGLWTVLQPCARPTKLETLNKKRLAVDASIWIYQFLKAVRDKEGNALRNSHVVGFFRRICKLLFFGIKPVFVFDGGAPALKRQTIAARQRRREGRREDAVRTAGKLLAVQMQRRLEEDQQRRKQARENRAHVVPDGDEEPIPDELVYVEELQMTAQERRQNRVFKKTDQYHLPELEASLENMGAPDDPRIMSQAELEEYARQFHSGEDINLYDFSKIDFDSAFFLSLPASDRYNILNAARLRSRLRMGLSKEQLDVMFPDRMAFSRFQVERVTERNDLTQRLMNLHGMNGDDAFLAGEGGGRVAGEKGREYVLVKNDGVEGGWALGVVSNNKDDGGRNQPIDVDRVAELADREDDAAAEWEDVDVDDGFEDVPIEGLNRLPRLTASERVAHTTRRLDAMEDEEPDTLFVGEETDVGSGRNADDLFNETSFMSDDDEDMDLDRAIAMSLEGLDELALQNRLVAADPSGKDVVTTTPSANQAAEHATEAGAAYASDSDDDMDLQAALAQSRLSELQTRHDPANRQPRPDISTIASSSKLATTAFDGPLPFEQLYTSRARDRTGTSDKLVETAGGFELDPVDDDDDSGPAKALPLPPWFLGDPKTDLQTQLVRERASHRRNEEASVRGERLPILHFTDDVIDVDSSSEESQADNAGGLGLLDGEQANDRTKSRESVQEEAAREGLSKDQPIDVDEVDEGEKVDAGSRKGLKGDTSGTQPAFMEDTTRVSRPVEARSPAAELPEAKPFEWDASDEEDGVMKADTNDQLSRIPNLDEVERKAPEKVVAPDDINTIDPYQIIEDDNAGEYSDPEEEQLMQQLATEAEEHARFASSLNQKPQVQNHEDYERELRSLRTQQRKDRRDADEVNHVMVTECQQLLTLFGLPYITAPMEAEAQCAELVHLGLVDGIVTDDSDCFLFGGTRVYKNMFNQAKFVECYLASDLEKEFDLTRDKLIRFAHLLGSDYTEGIPGVGPVTALEILSEFDSDRGLDDFRDWWQEVQRGKAAAEEGPSPFRKKFRRNATRIFLPPAFPSTAVTDAYLHPDVDSSEAPFQWGVPNLDALRSFLMATIGWTPERTDEVLVPVIQDMTRRAHEGTQSNLTAFFSGGTGAGVLAPRRKNPDDVGRGRGGGRRKPASRRIEGALGRMKEGAERKRGRRAKAGGGQGDPSREADHESDESEAAATATTTTDAVPVPVTAKPGPVETGTEFAPDRNEPTAESYFSADDDPLPGAVAGAGAGAGAKRGDRGPARKRRARGRLV